MNRNQKKIISALERIGMYITDEEISSAISFIGGFDYACDYSVLDGFREWLVSEYFESGNPFGWGYLLNLVVEQEKEFDGKVKKIILVLHDFFTSMNKVE